MIVNISLQMVKTLKELHEIAPEASRGGAAKTRENLKQRIGVYERHYAECLKEKDVSGVMFAKSTNNMEGAETFLLHNFELPDNKHRDSNKTPESGYVYVVVFPKVDRKSLSCPF